MREISSFSSNEKLEIALDDADEVNLILTTHRVKDCLSYSKKQQSL